MLQLPRNFEFPLRTVKVWVKVISCSSCLKSVAIASKLVKMSKTPFITVDFTPPVTRNYVPTTVFAGDKPRWCMVGILCQGQIIINANCGSHYFLHQSNISSYCPSEYSPLCCQNLKSIFSCSPRSWHPLIINSFTLVKVFARIWLHEPGLKWKKYHLQQWYRGDLCLHGGKGSGGLTPWDVVRMLEQTQS